MSAAYHWDDFVLDLDGYRLERAGRPVPLEPKAFNLLVLMIARPGHLFTKQELFNAVWPDTAVTDHALTRVIAQLRRGLGDEAREARYIETVPTRGYRWMRPVEALVPPAPVAPIPTPAPIPAPVIDERSAPPVRPSAAPRAAVRPLFSSLAAALAAATALLLAMVWLQPPQPTAATDELPDRPMDARWRNGSVGWPVQITTHNGLDMHPSISPQGDALAYVSDRTGSLEVYTRALGVDGAETALTSDGGQNIQPAWSPDGRLIAFHSSKHRGIWVSPSRGGQPRQVAPTGSNPSWSPDGRRIAFQSDEHTDVTPSAFGAQSGSTIWTVDADGTNLQQVTKPGSPLGGHAAPTWSSSGRFLAFTVFEAGDDNGVWLLALDTGKTTVVERGSALYELVFAPDDSAIYVAGGIPLIVRLPIDRATGKVSGPRTIIPVAGVPGVRGLSITPDGKQLAFGGLTLTSQIWGQPVNKDGAPRGEARPITTDTSFRKSLPAVSPDGARVAYMSTRRGEMPDVWVMDIDGERRVPLTSDIDFKPGWFRWFPDGRHLAFVATRGTTRGLWSMDLATRRQELIHDLRTQTGEDGAPRIAGRLAEFQLSPSVSRAAFSIIAPPSGRRVLYVSPMSSFSPRIAATVESSVGYPSWSPDERQIAVEVKDGSSTHAAVIDVTSGTLRKLTSEPGQTWVRSWSPDSRKIAYAALRDGLWSLRWIDVTTGHTGITVPPAPPHIYVRYPDWSPRGDLVVYERGELRGNIWMLPVP